MFRRGFIYIYIFREEITFIFKPIEFYCLKKLFYWLILIIILDIIINTCEINDYFLLF